MILVANQRGGRAQLVRHLLSEENERVTLLQTRGVYSQDLAGMLAEFDATASGTMATKPFFHASISPAPDVEMSESDWARAWDLFEEVQGLKGLSFVELAHDKNALEVALAPGEPRHHRHRVYNRIDPETGTARNLGCTRIKNERIARQLEIELGHEITPGRWTKRVLHHLEKEGLTEVANQLRHLATGAPAIPLYTHEEWQAAKRGAPVALVREALAEAWRSSDSPQAFEAALAGKGFAMAMGDSVPVAVGLDGQEVALLRHINAGRKVAGEPPIKKAELAARLPGKLPDLDAVREAQAEREAQQLQESAKFTESETMQQKAQENPAPTTTGSLTAGGKAEKAIKAKGTAQDKPSWVKFREEMLFDVYGRGLKNTNFVRYWKMEITHDGAVEFTNKAGTVVDDGSKIFVEAKDRHLQQAATAALFVAQAKGWDEVRVNGSSQFKEAVYRLAIEHDTALKIDSEDDQALFNRLREEMGKAEPTEEHANSIEAVKAEKPEEKDEQEKTGVVIKKGHGHLRDDTPGDVPLYDEPGPEHANSHTPAPTSKGPNMG